MPRWNHHGHRYEKKDWSTIYLERRIEFVDAIEKAGTIGQAMLKNNLRWGDGIFERTKRDALEIYAEDINFNSNTKIFSSINLELEKPTITVTTDWECEL